MTPSTADAGTPRKSRWSLAAPRSRWIAEACVYGAALAFLIFS